MDKKKVSIMIPAYNEELVLCKLFEAIDKLMARHPEYIWEVLFINDGSKDSTLNIIKEKRKMDDRYCYVSLSRNFGKEKAMAAGFDYVTGDCLINMDADLQDPPELIEGMLELWEQGYDDVYAKRKSRGEESWLRKHLSLSFYWLLQKMTKIEILPNVGDFRLLDRRCINSLKSIHENERYTKGLYCWIGYHKKEILFDRGNRAAGKSSWNFWSLFGLAIEGIVTFTTKPLRFASVLGVCIALFSFVYMLYFFTKTLIWGDSTTGFPTLIIVMLFLGGVQLLSLGIIGEYIGRIFVETKHRPVYIADEYNSIKQGYHSEKQNL